MHFDGDGAIKGAKIEQYLLEKSRIVGQQLNERNYHIFYQLHVGAPAELKSKLLLSKMEDYRIVMMGQCPDLPSMDDKKEWEIMNGIFPLRMLPCEWGFLCTRAISF